MSVYNRKMFKRNARNALNQSAGIPSVQRFQTGGAVSSNPIMSVLRGMFTPTPAFRPPVVTPAATMSSAQADRIVASNTVSQNVERNSESPVFNIYCKIGDKDVLADVVKVAMNDGFKTGGIATS